MSTAAHIADVKARKNSAWILSNGWFNHPHRLGAIDTSGSLSYTIDERDFTSPGTSVKVYEFSLDFSLADGYTRLFEDKVPWRVNTTSIGTPPGGAPGAGEFYMGHRPRRMWEAQTTIGTTDYATIGTCDETTWTRPAGSPPYTWTAGATTQTDLDFRFVLFISKGGEPDSEGRGDGSDDEKIEIQFQDQYTGTNAGKLPNLASSSPHILRLPWNDSWASETSIFSTAFSDHLTAENTADGGGHSGTCSLSLDFT